MSLQVFIQNPNSGEPWALCGPALGDWQNLAKTLGYFAQAEVAAAAESKYEPDRKFSIDFKIVEMSEEEIAALPDI